MGVTARAHATMSNMQAMYAMMRAKAEAAKAAKAAGDDAGSSSAAAPPPPASLTEPTKLSLEPPAIKPPAKGVVVVFGATNFADMGRRVVGTLETEDTPNLMRPSRLLAGFGDVRIVSVATGGSSAHCIAIGADGECFAWGRNDVGQLGLGDLDLRTVPTLLPTKGTPLADKPIVSASTGKSHTVFLTRSGELFASGSTKHGCVGNGYPKRAEHVASPIAVSAAAGGGGTFTAVASGSNFNLAIDAEGDVWSWGWSEFGVLGNGTDGEHNTKDGAVKLSYLAEASPRRIPRLLGLKTIDVACGAHHCASISSEGVVFTWGAGGYGRLGHKDQKDVWTPKPLEEIRGRKACCGSASTAVFGWPVLRSGVVCTGAPSLYMMGRVRAASQNAWMYPKTEDELRGWTLHTMALGAGHNVVHADDATITWGSGCSSGELGLTGKKSSSQPAKADALDGVGVAQVQCGIANTLLLVESSAAVDKLPTFTPAPPSAAPATAEDADDAADGKGGKGKGKRPASAAPAGGKGKKKK